VLKDGISTWNTDILAKYHSIGKKSAESIIMELSDKDISAIPAKFIVPAVQKWASRSRNIRDAIAALVSLGYKTADAERAIRQAIE
jgi:Holliday junction resolvasome RuvABC DNA-binding subunit